LPGGLVGFCGTRSGLPLSPACGIVCSGPCSTRWSGALRNGLQARCRLPAQCDNAEPAPPASSLSKRRHPASSSRRLPMLSPVPALFVAHGPYRERLTRRESRHVGRLDGKRFRDVGCGGAERIGLRSRGHGVHVWEELGATSGPSPGQVFAEVESGRSRWRR
jgi:hypothetical protein